MSSNGSEENKVGYGKPPVGTRFKKGKSGNPGGRPKGIKSKAAIAHDALSREVLVPIDGKRKKITIEELASRALGAKAAQGDLSAIIKLMEWREPLVPVCHVDEVYSFTLRLDEDDPPHEHRVLPHMRK